MSAPIGTHAETRTAIALVAHLDRDDITSVPDALNVLRNAAEDGITPERVAVVLARMYAAHRAAVGIDNQLWASIALPASVDWDREPEGGTT